MQIEIKTYTAIQLVSELSLLDIAASPNLPEDIRLELLRGMAANPDIKEFCAQLKEQLDVKLKASQEARIEQLTSASLWNEYTRWLQEYQGTVEPQTWYAISEYFVVWRSLSGHVAIVREENDKVWFEIFDQLGERLYKASPMRCNSERDFNGAQKLALQSLIELGFKR